MTKFSAQSITVFFTQPAIEGRLARKAKYVVCVEVDDGSWCELDADDADHAYRLAVNWVDVMDARGASCWCVSKTGELGGRPFKTYYSQPKWED